MEPAIEEEREYIEDNHPLRTIVKTKEGILRTLIKKGCLSCIDGRRTEFTLGVPGGIAGALYAVLLTIRRSRQLEVGELESIGRTVVKKLVDRYGNIPLIHTDGHSVGDTENLSYPRLRAHLLEDNSNIGCGHLRRILNSGDRESADIVRLVIKNIVDVVDEVVTAESGYRGRLSQDSDPLRYIEVLFGEHKEQRIIKVLLTAKNIQPIVAGIRRDCRVQALKPKDSRQGYSVFVYHPNVEEFLLEQMLKFTGLRGGTERDLRIAKGIAIREYKSTITVLANGLRSYKWYYRVDQRKGRKSVPKARS